MLNLDQIEQDLVWARDNADRSAQTRLFVHHVPQMLRELRGFEQMPAPEFREEFVDPSEEVDEAEDVEESEASEELEIELEEDVEASLDAEVEAVAEESTSIFPDEDEEEESDE